MSALHIWMNGELVGTWRVGRTGNHRLDYDPSWRAFARSLSTFAFSPVYLQQPVGGGRGEDGRNFLCAQLLFWLLAAIDGHAKNFSLFVLQGGRYRMTPLYDVLSAWPLIGPAKRGTRRLAKHGGHDAKTGRGDDVG